MIAPTPTEAPKKRKVEQVQEQGQEQIQGETAKISR